MEKRKFMIIVLVIISLLLFTIVVGCPLLVTLCYDYFLISIDSGSMISFLGSYVGAIITGLISIFCILVSVYFARNQSKKEQDLMIRPYFDFMYNTTDKPTFLKKDIGYIAFEFDPEENNNAKHEPEISGLLVLKNVGLGTALHCQFGYEVNDCTRDRRQMLFSNPKTIVGVRTFQPGDEGSITFSILLNFESIPKEKIVKGKDGRRHLLPETTKKYQDFEIKVILSYSDLMENKYSQVLVFKSNIYSIINQILDEDGRYGCDLHLEKVMQPKKEVVLRN